MKNYSLVLTCLAVLLGLVACGGGYKSKDEENKQREESYAGQMVSAMQRGSLAGAKADLETIRKSLEVYSADHGQYPDAPDFAALVSALSPTYIGLPPERDDWGGLIEGSSWAEGYKLIAPGADRVSGTADDVVLEPGGFTQVPPK